MVSAAARGFGLGVIGVIVAIAARFTQVEVALIVPFISGGLSIAGAVLIERYHRHSYPSSYEDLEREKVILEREREKDSETIQRLRLENRYLRETLKKRHP